MSGRSLAAVVLLCLWGLVGCTSAVLSGAGRGDYQADGRSYEEARSDQFITAEVNRRLIRDPSVAGIDIGVTTYRAVVTLRGIVGDAHQSRRAEALAAGVAGVEGVVNLLKIKSN